MTVQELARLPDCPPAEVLDALHHLQKSFRHRRERLDITPARSRSCGFEFWRERIQQTRRASALQRRVDIEEPLISVQTDEARNGR